MLFIKLFPDYFEFYPYKMGVIVVSYCAPITGDYTYGKVPVNFGFYFLVEWL